MIGEAIGNVMAWSLFGLMVCIALIITLAIYWLTR
jgi:hypothetical protein